MASRVDDALSQRKLTRFFEQCEDLVAAKVLRLLEQEFQGRSRERAPGGGASCRRNPGPSACNQTTLIQLDMDPRRLERELLQRAGNVVRARALLSQGGKAGYDLVLRESCDYLVQMVSTRLHTGSVHGAASPRLAHHCDSQRRLRRLPQRHDLDDFVTDYRRFLANRLDRTELFGVTSHGASPGASLECRLYEPGRDDTVKW
jgi:hypothetical protein